MSERQTCVDCRALSPETETNYTLIGSRHGWRLTRRRDARGPAVMEWRCPKCWRAHKAAVGEGPRSSSSGELPAVEAPSGTRSVAPSAESARSKSTVPPRRGRAR